MWDRYHHLLKPFTIVFHYRFLSDSKKSSHKCSFPRRTKTIQQTDLQILPIFERFSILFSLLLVQSYSLKTNHKHSRFFKLVEFMNLKIPLYSKEAWIRVISSRNGHLNLLKLVAICYFLCCFVFDGFDRRLYHFDMLSLSPFLIMIHLRSQKSLFGSWSLLFQSIMQIPTSTMLPLPLQFQVVCLCYSWVLDIDDFLLYCVQLFFDSFMCHFFPPCFPSCSKWML